MDEPITDLMETIRLDEVVLSDAVSPLTVSTTNSAVTTVNENRYCRTDSLAEIQQNNNQFVADRLSSLLNNPNSSDISFTFNDDKMPTVLYAHKLILSVSSPVFSAMINSKLQQTDKILITDVSYSGFFEILRYLYTDKVILHEEICPEILYAAHKYDLPFLEKICEDYLTKTLNVENVCNSYENLYVFDNNITQKCLKIIEENTSMVVTSENFRNLSIDPLRCILAMENLRIKENLLFDSVLLWAERQCERQHLETTAENLREVLQDCIHLIRFPIMTIDEFAVFTQRLPEFFTHQEIADIFQFISTGDQRSNLLFPITKRNGQLYVPRVLTRYTDVSIKDFPFGVCSFEVHVNKPIKISYIGIYAGVSVDDGLSLRETLNLKINCFSYDDLSNQLDVNEEIIYDSKQIINKIVLSDPYKIEPNLRYRIMVMFLGKHLPKKYYYGVTNQKMDKQEIRQEDGVIFKIQEVSILFVHVRSDRIAEIGYELRSD